MKIISTILVLALAACGDVSGPLVPDEDPTTCPTPEPPPTVEPPPTTTYGTCWPGGIEAPASFTYQVCAFAQERAICTWSEGGRNGSILRMTNCSPETGVECVDKCQ